MKRLLILSILIIIISTSVYATEYSDVIDKSFSSSGSMLWKPSVNGTIESLKVVGDIFGDGEIQVHMIKDGNQYLLFKRSISNDGLQPKEHIEFEEGTNIGLILSYGDSRWDKDNDGVAPQDEGIDFKLEPLFFDQFYDEYLCTLWEVYNLEREEIYSECYGSSKCCKFVGYDPIVQDWDEDYVLFKGEKNSGSKNIVIARIIYFDGINIEYSNHDGLATSFIGNDIQKEMNFTYESIFQSGNYFLRVTVDDDTIFHLKEIKYEIKNEK
ncbi:hypothetical protein KY334_06330 [Candidatus Woesearchaeota archaeon]|nr:hypothetical protein [Candidatus Woesearchaeota archaeon]